MNTKVLEFGIVPGAYFQVRYMEHVVRCGIWPYQG